MRIPCCASQGTSGRDGARRPWTSGGNIAVSAATSPCPHDSRPDAPRPDAPRCPDARTSLRGASGKIQLDAGPWPSAV